MTCAPSSPRPRPWSWGPWSHPGFAAALDDLLIELTVGETYFFRTPEHFEHLRRVLLPELRERHGPGHTVRLWSSACSSGEEPSSLAALLQAEGWGQHMSVYATDVSRGALARARQAHYGEWSLRGPWADRMRPHLRAEGRRYVLSPEVQQRVQFGYLNLALDYQAMTTLFTHPPDPQGMYTLLAHLAVPDLADWCLVDAPEQGPWGQGSTFTFTLPAIPGAPLALPPTVRAAPHD